MPELAEFSEWIPQLVHASEWTFSALLLMVVAWARFNTPPTNRSGTTLALFSFGLIFYYIMIVALWLVLFISVKQGSVGFDKTAIWLGRFNPDARGEFEPYAPLIAAFLVVVAAYFPWVCEIDKAAREFCFNL